MWAGGPCSRWTPPHGPTRPRICSVCHFVFSQHWNREAKINSQTDTKQRDRETAIQRPVTEKRWRQGRSMPPDGKAPKWMEPSVQSLSHAWVECSIGWHSCGCWTGWTQSGQSQPLSLIMCASSMMYLPSLYF